MTLPAHHPDDARWLRAKLDSLPARYRAKAMEGYGAAYQAAYDAEPLEHKRENAARFAANTKLREFIGKVFTGAKG